MRSHVGPEDEVWDSYLPSGERVRGVCGKVRCPHCWERRNLFVNQAFPPSPGLCQTLGV